MSYRVDAVQDDPAKQRVLVIAAEDYTGTSPNRTPGYDTAPRYLAAHVAALEAAGYEVETFDVDAPPENADATPSLKYPTALGVLSHFDAVLWYSGDDFIPQDASEPDPRYLSTATAQSGSMQLASWAHKTMIALRDYLNEGGKAIVAGRNIHQWPTGSASLSATGPYQWAPDKVFGFFYPDGNAGDDDLPGTAFQRYRGISNDTWQNYLGVVGRQGGYGTTTPDTSSAVAATGGLFDGMAPIAIDQSSGNDPNQGANGVSAPRAKLASRLRNWSGLSAQEPLRQERVELDVPAPPAQTGGLALSTADTVTFGFGLEQVGTAVRNELVARAMAHLLPTTPDTAAPLVAFKWPAADGFAGTTRDPVEVDVTAADARGDMKEVRLLADGELVGTNRTFPFQFRWTPGAAQAGKTVTLTAEAVDKAGNVATATRTVDVTDVAADVEAPLPVGKPTLAGTPTVGSTLTCVSGGFVNTPTGWAYAWFAGGEPIAGAAGEQYTLTAAELGEPVSCRITASNSAGDADATSDGKYVSVAAVPGTGGPGRPGRSGGSGRPGRSPGPARQVPADQGHLHAQAAEHRVHGEGDRREGQRRGAADEHGPAGRPPAGRDALGPPQRDRPLQGPVQAVPARRRGGPQGPRGLALHGHAGARRQGRAPERGTLRGVRGVGGSAPAPRRRGGLPGVLPERLVERAQPDAVALGERAAGREVLQPVRDRVRAARDALAQRLRARGRRGSGSGLARRSTGASTRSGRRRRRARAAPPSGRAPRRPPARCRVAARTAASSFAETSGRLRGDFHAQTTRNWARV